MAKKQYLEAAKSAIIIAEEEQLNGTNSHRFNERSLIEDDS